jgi:hypothetical protein
MSVEREIIRQNDTLLINAKRTRKEEDFREVTLKQEDYEGEVERVTVKVGTTLCPKAYDSIRVDYSCTIHHQPGLQYRDEAFDTAKFHCLERLKDDVMDLYQNGYISVDHPLVDAPESPEKKPENKDDTPTEKEPKEKNKPIDEPKESTPSKKKRGRPKGSKSLKKKKVKIKIKD